MHYFEYVTHHPFKLSQIEYSHAYISNNKQKQSQQRIKNNLFDISSQLIIKIFSNQLSCLSSF